MTECSPQDTVCQGNFSWAWGHPALSGMRIHARERVVPRRTHSSSQGSVLHRRKVAGILAEGAGAKHAAHDLSAACFREGVHEFDGLGLGDRSHLVTDVALEFFFELVVHLHAGLEDDESVDDVALDFVRESDGGGFGDGGMRNERALDFGGAETIAADLDDVVDAADDPVIAVGVAAVTSLSLFLTFSEFGNNIIVQNFD